MTTLDTDNNTQVSLDDPQLNALADNETVEIDWEAKESGGGPYTPRVYPGIYPFLFSLEDEKPFEFKEYDTKKGEHIKEFTVNHKATVSINDADGNPQEVVIRFCQAGFHTFTGKDGKKFNSRGVELIRSLGITPEQLGGNKPTYQLIEQALRQADGNVMGRCVVNWERYDKDTKTTTSTEGRKNQVRWPKGVDGKYVADQGREKVTGYKLPQ